ncbi:MAG: hypothetical protein AB1646_03835 [Thermodesulfobacteriota bacterium]
MASRANRRQFLDALFSDYFRSRRGYILVRSAGDWVTDTRPLFFFNTDLLAKQVFDPRRNVRFGVCPRERMKDSSEEIQYLAALWANIDIGEEGHPETACFEDVSQAIKAVKDFPREASIIVNSGRGMHLYWLLESPHKIVDRLRVERVLATITLRLNCRPLGQLSTELRLPDTVNNKMEDKPVRCYVEHLNPNIRYQMEDFEDLDRQITRTPLRSRPQVVLSTPEPGDFAAPDRQIPSLIRRARADLQSLLEGEAQAAAAPSADDETVAMSTEDLPVPVARGSVARVVDDPLTDEPTVTMTTEDLPAPVSDDDQSSVIEDLFPDEGTLRMTTEDLPATVTDDEVSRVMESLFPYEQTPGTATEDLTSRLTGRDTSREVERRFSDTGKHAPDDHWTPFGPIMEADAARSEEPSPETDEPGAGGESWDSDFTGRGYGYAGEDDSDFDPDTVIDQLSETAEQRLARDLASDELSIIVDADSEGAEDKPLPSKVSTRAEHELSPGSPPLRPDSELEPDSAVSEPLTFAGLEDIPATAGQLSPATLLAQHGLGAEVPEEPASAAAGPGVALGQVEKDTADSGFLGRIRTKLNNLRPAKNGGLTPHDAPAGISPEVSGVAGRVGQPEPTPTVGRPVFFRSGATQCGLFTAETVLPATWTALIQPGKSFSGKPLEFYLGSKQVGVIRLPEAWRTNAPTGELELAVTCHSDFMHVRLRDRRSDWQRTYRFPMKSGT